MILQSGSYTTNQNIPIYNNLIETENDFNYTIILPEYFHKITELSTLKPTKHLHKGFTILVPELRCSCMDYGKTKNTFSFLCKHIINVLKTNYKKELTPLSYYFATEKNLADKYYIIESNLSNVLLVGIIRNSDWLQIIHYNNTWIKNLYNAKEKRWNHQINPPFTQNSKQLFDQLLTNHLSINL